MSYARPSPSGVPQRLRGYTRPGPIPLPDRGKAPSIHSIAKKRSSRKLGGQDKRSKPLPLTKIRDIDYLGNVTIRVPRDEQRDQQALMTSIEMTLSEQIRMLSGADFLEPLSEQQLEKLAARCPDILYKQGENISMSVYAGDEGFFYIVKQGRVRVYELGPEGQEHTLTEIRDGTAFAAQRLNDAYAQAMEQTILVVLRREDMKHLIESCPELGMRFIEALIKSLRASESRSADIALKEVPARLASLLLELVEAGGVVTGEGYKLPTHYTHERLGSMIGAKREAVTRAFGRLQDEGAVELRRRLIYIKDIEELRRIARGRTASIH